MPVMFFDSRLNDEPHGGASSTFNIAMMQWDYKLGTFIIYRSTSYAHLAHMHPHANLA